ncbi:sodium-dependent neutral amino acid transporter B(0)AT2 isoform X2 [Brienomyrus brachyistius]|uniref:sodium-dependent neutral amino acid transporter B(0)AT2 isoform X2 n=1 Tax=Brienomyrus brachyistius TaxID=42636 RepID=UPI0020B2F22C|nr:sodium-dependent neutral amino acid transporter B(0)AT2 isoform X2 [Brienomyrus brachyistius]
MKMEKTPLPTDEEGVHTPDGQSDTIPLEPRAEQAEGHVVPEPGRPAWDSKLQYVLAQVGFSVGLGNVWRFPYLCHQNGGGAFLLLYVLLLMLVGVPLFFLELAAGQSVRQGSIGVWKHVAPQLAGIGYSSCMVCFYVALYYNVIIAWSLFYLSKSFQSPLPWEQCPIYSNFTVQECSRTSPTTYFWFREALDITDSIEQTGQFNPKMTGCLMAAWVIVCLAMIKGIKSSAKVMYFSSVFPYIVLLCFLLRGLLLDGASEGISYMFYPKLQIWGEVQVWRQAATQVFFALGLGFGSVIAYSSYNPPNNNCHRDALMVSLINLLTSVLASLVVFAVLGFRAKSMAMACVLRNVGLLTEMSAMGSVQHLLLPWANGSDPGSVSLWEYREWFQQYGAQMGSGITDCSLEEEMNQGVEGTGLAFIAFTEAMVLFPASPFWSMLFFLMLLNLGLSTMFGTMQGILTPLSDNFHLLRRHKTLLTVASCILGFLIGLLFTQRSGNYFVTMFDDYSATLPLIIVVVFETLAVSWIYGADRFLDDIEVMLQWRPPVVYKYLWQFVCLLAMVGLLGASLLRMFFKWPTYTAWNQSMASERVLPYPGWALALLSLLILLACLPLPVLYIHTLLRRRLGSRGAPLEAGLSHRDTYMKCETDEPAAAQQLIPLEGEQESDRGSFLSLGAEHYRLLPQKDLVEEDIEEDTGV